MTNRNPGTVKLAALTIAVAVLTVMTVIFLINAASREAADSRLPQPQEAVVQPMPEPPPQPEPEAETEPEPEVTPEVEVTPETEPEVEINPEAEPEPDPPVISLQDYANNSPVDITADTTVRNQQLRDYVRQIVANFQTDRPWLQQTWHYIESQGENFSLQVSASNTLPGVERSERDATGGPECQPTDNPQDPFILSNVAEMHFPTSRFAHPNILQAAGNESTVIHELAHVYTLSCLAHPDNLLPMAATHLYFEDLSLAQAQDRRSFGYELLADAMVAEMESLLTWPEHARYHYYTAPLW